MSKDLHIRPFVPSDIARVAQSFADAFHVHRPLDEWASRFVNAPACAMVACKTGSDQPLAFYGATLHRATMHAREWRVGHIVDVFSHPDARQDHPHLFEHTAKAFFDRFCGPDGIQLLYGFPSRGPSRQGERFLSYRRLATPRWLSCDLSAPIGKPAVVSYAGMVAPLRDFTCLGDRIRPARVDWLHFDMSATELARRFPLQGGKYRAFALIQTGGDEPLGLVVVRIVGATAWLMSLHTAQPALALGMWTRLALFLRAAGARRVATMISPAHHLTGLLGQLGFVGIEPELPLIPTFRVFDPALDGDALVDQLPYDLFHTDIF